MAAWKQFTIKSDPVLIADRTVIAKWTGDTPLGGWVLHYWGHPLCSKLPKQLQPNGKVGHQYLECADDAAVAARYAELCNAIRRVAPKATLSGPAPETPKLVSALAKKSAYFTLPDDNGLTLQLERTSAFLRAETALAGDNELAATACVFATGAGDAIVSSLSGRCHVTTQDRDIVFVNCDKSGEKKALANVLAGKLDEEACGKLTLTGPQLVVVPARASGAKNAIAVPCVRGTYEVRTGYDYPVGVLRLRRSS